MVFCFCCGFFFFFFCKQKTAYEMRISDWSSDVCSSDLEHLGGHDHYRCVSVYRVVAGEQADLVGAVAPGEVGVLLVGQRLDGSGVEGLATLGQRPGHGVLRHHRLAGPGGCGHEHGSPRVESVEGPQLEPVEGEVVGGEEIAAVDHQAGSAAARRRSTSQPTAIDSS